MAQSACFFKPSCFSPSPVSIIPLDGVPPSQVIKEKESQKLKMCKTVPKVTEIDGTDVGEMSTWMNRLLKRILK
jgi:hypothetical protein